MLKIVYHNFQNDKSHLSWTDLYDRRIVIVEGEAGIGKTVEFKNEVKRLQNKGKYVFFIPLNQILNNETWRREINISKPNFVEWEQSSEDGYFFLDSIDEARLASHAAFRTALSVIRDGLSVHMARVRIIISSRITDLEVEDVKNAIQEHLIVPIEVSQKEAELELNPSSYSTTYNITDESENSIPEKFDEFVFSLDPLSRTEAERLAIHFQVIEPKKFWSAVDDGDYEFMITRPLDLNRMVGQWNKKGALGTYLELMEENVSNRLTETNANYESDNTNLSPEKLRTGVELLAAVTEFSGRSFLSITPKIHNGENEVASTEVLTKWKKAEITRLLATAIFDEATYGRIKFHHRSIREYLAACWVKNQLEKGVPFLQFLPIFCQSPFGAPVLVPNNKAILSWLSTLDIKVREWVTYNFPEILMFESGDPESWDATLANLAFQGYVKKLKSGFRYSLFTDRAQLKRVSHKISPAILISSLDPRSPPHLIVELLPLVNHGRFYECADAVFNLYKNSRLSTSIRRYSLDTLCVIGSDKHRILIKKDLLTGKLKSDRLIGAALSLIDLKEIKTEEFVKIFQSSFSKYGYGTEPIAEAINIDILPNADLELSKRLLTAILKTLPASNLDGKLSKFLETEQSENASLFNVLPNCLERVLTLLPKNLDSYPITCIKAAKLVEMIQHSGYIDQSELQKLFTLICEHPVLRMQIALEIAKSDDIIAAVSRLTWGLHCLVAFGVSDIPELTSKANDLALDKTLRDIWFEVVTNIAFNKLKGRTRHMALEKLIPGPDSELRRTKINNLLQKHIKGSLLSRKHNKTERKHRLKKNKDQQQNKNNLLGEINLIKDGTHVEILSWLVGYSYENTGRKNLNRVDFNLISRDFGQEISDALKEGIIKYWEQAETPNPADYSNSIPWKGIIGLAGCYLLIETGVNISSLKDTEAERLAKLSVWKLNGPPSWFEQLVINHENVVCSALLPWIKKELAATPNQNYSKRTLELLLQCPKVARKKILKQLVPLIKKGTVLDSFTLKSVFEAMMEDDLIDPNVVDSICQANVTNTLDDKGLINEMGWFRSWFVVAPLSAWSWFESHLACLDSLADDQIQDFAKNFTRGKWTKSPLSESSITVLLKIYSLLAKYKPKIRPTSSLSEKDNVFWHPVNHSRRIIHKIISQTYTPFANQALNFLVDKSVDNNERLELNYSIDQQAENKAQLSAQHGVSTLQIIGAPFMADPVSENQLFKQVVARLEEICIDIEEGPFSNRGLFKVETSEEQIQLWLATRFQDTQNRKFTVTREEEVDNKKKTDIQLGCKHGKVCVEIKPVDRNRGYTAKSLTTTLRKQIVGQYLKKGNSAHGILVLFRLDNKTWDIPGVKKKKQPFDKLVSYLQRQAETIKKRTNGIQELVIFPIDCLKPTKNRNHIDK